jgi:hypothetical protein
MKQMSKFLLLLSITLLMAGCKLAVIVVEGGEVQSTGSGTCAEGTICIVDVTDTNFSERFAAIPDDGWYFQKWNSGDRFFCGGSTDSICTLSFQGLEDSKAVEDMVASSELFYLMPVFKPYQDIITVDGKEWLQPYLFTNLSWNDINAICPEGVCAGLLNGYDMSGWTWASIDDANALFNHYIGSDELGPGPDGPTVIECTAVDDFFRDGWRPLPHPRITQSVWGWPRWTDNSELVYAAYIGPAPPGCISSTGTTHEKTESGASIGGLFWRSL